MALELDQRLLLDLAHAFARQAHLGGQLFQRGGFDVIEAKTALDHVAMLVISCDSSRWATS